MRERKGCLSKSQHCYITDVPDSRNDYYVNGCDPNISLSHGLFLEIHRYVRRRSIPSLRSVQCGPCHRSASARYNLPPSGFMTSKNNRIPIPSVPPGFMESVMHSTYEQYQTPQTSQHASFISGEGLPDNLTRLELDDDV